MPPNVVLTPLALLTAPRERAPVTGIDFTNDETMLHIPKANISCVASMLLPSAVNQNVLYGFGKFFNNNNTYKTLLPMQCSPRWPKVAPQQYQNSNSTSYR